MNIAFTGYVARFCHCPCFFIGINVNPRFLLIQIFQIITAKEFLAFSDALVKR